MLRVASTQLQKALNCTDTNRQASRVQFLQNNQFAVRISMDSKRIQPDGHSQLKDVATKAW